MPDQLSGQVALITGGGRGIGREIARLFAREGAAVALTARSAQQLAETQALIQQETGRSPLTVTGDVSKAADVAAVCEQTQAALGPVTILVNNAGITGPFGPIWEVDPAEWWYTQEVHMRGAFQYIHGVVPGMIERGSGRVINVVSGAGVRVVPYFSGYGVAKAAQIRFTETLATEGREHGLIAFAMAPGLVPTELGDSVMRSDDAQRWMPDFIDRLEQAKSDESGDAMARATGLCLALASGRADALSGRYLTPADDLATLVATA